MAHRHCTKRLLGSCPTAHYSVLLRYSVVLLSTVPILGLVLPIAGDARWRVFWFWLSLSLLSLVLASWRWRGCCWQGGAGGCRPWLLKEEPTRVPVDDGGWCRPEGSSWRFGAKGRAGSWPIVPGACIASSWRERPCASRPRRKTTVTGPGVGRPKVASRPGSW
jgi:hypothetical protein